MNLDAVALNNQSPEISCQLRSVPFVPAKCSEARQASRSTFPRQSDFAARKGRLCVSASGRRKVHPAIGHSFTLLQS